MSIALFFKFNRLWSVRNLDLIGLVLLAPGLLAVEYGGYKASTAAQQLGFIWIFAVSGAFIIRMLVDSLMVRRPLLETNLTIGGMVFLGISLLYFSWPMSSPHGPNAMIWPVLHRPRDWKQAMPKLMPTNSLGSAQAIPSSFCFRRFRHNAFSRPPPMEPTTPMPAIRTDESCTKTLPG